MIIRKPIPDTGICFAWRPLQTPEGKVWLEWVHWRFFEGWGWGSGGSYEYRRFIPDEAYDRGERVQWT